MCLQFTQFLPFSPGNFFLLLLKLHAVTHCLLQFNRSDLVKGLNVPFDLVRVHSLLPLLGHNCLLVVLVLLLCKLLFFLKVQWLHSAHFAVIFLGFFAEF